MAMKSVAGEGPSALSSDASSGGITWSWTENKLFENLLEEMLENGEDQGVDTWNKMANRIPGKTSEDVLQHYRKLTIDVENIANGLIPLPRYSDAFAKTTDVMEHRLGVPWSDEEHKNFLLGLREHGKGQWTTISREFVTTRTAQQIASHAQKFFKRRGEDRRRMRHSIHDISL